MTTEEKAKAYDGALELARANHKFYKEHTDCDEHFHNNVKLLEAIFPELRESEDERIRQALIGHFRTLPYELSVNGFSKEKFIAWLEKQKERKPLIKKGVKYYCIKAQKRRTDFYTYAFTIGTEYIAPENNVLVDNDGHSWDLTRQTPEWIFERFTPKEPNS